MITAITFDWGGVFTEGTFDADAVRNLAGLCAVPEERIAQTYYPLMARFEAGDFTLDEFVASFAAQSGLEFAAASFRRTFLGSGRERPEMYRVLAAIPGGYRVGMLSNNVAELCDRVRRDPRMGRIEEFLFSNEIRVRKPDPRAYGELLRALGVQAEETVFIDDNADNIAACGELGMTGIHLADFPSFLAELRRYVPDLDLEPA